MAFLNTVLLGRGGGGIPPYTEFAYVQAPDSSSQTFPANVISTCFMNTVVANGGFGTLNAGTITFPAPNNVTTTFLLPIGTYYYIAELPAANNSSATNTGVFGLYNNTTSSYVTRTMSKGAHSYYNSFFMEGQMVTPIPTNYSLTLLPQTINYAFAGNYAGTSTTNSTVGASQTTTFRVWKIA